MFKRILKIFGVIVLIAYLAVCGYVWRIGQPERVVSKLDVVICDSAESQFVGNRDVMRIIHSSVSLNPVGKKIREFNAYRLEKVLEQNSLIGNADCYPTPNGTMRIDIYQRKPIMRIKSTRLSSDVYLDTDGRLMPYKATRHAVNVPLVTGYVTKETATGPLYEFAKFLNGNKKWRHRIVQIYVDEDQSIRLVPRKGDFTILLGSIDNFEKKLARYEVFEKKVLETKGWNTYKTINLKFNDQVVAVKR